VRGVQYTANQGKERTSICTTVQEGDFQVNKKGLMCNQKSREKGGLATERIIKGVVNMCLQCIYCANKSCV
jgi:hypothetical protein